MDAKCEMFMNCSKNQMGIFQNKYDCQTWNTKGIVDVKKQIWLIIIYWAVNLTLHGHYAHVCIILKVLA